MAGKGSKRRPRLISREEEELRWQLAEGKISRVTFNKRILEMIKEGKINRRR